MCFKKLPPMIGSVIEFFSASLRDNYKSFMHHLQEVKYWRWLQKHTKCTSTSSSTNTYLTTNRLQNRILICWWNFFVNIVILQKWLSKLENTFEEMQWLQEEHFHDSRAHMISHHTLNISNNMHRVNIEHAILRFQTRFFNNDHYIKNRVSWQGNYRKYKFIYF